MRVGENTTLNTVRDSLNRSRVRMNDLQRQNATQKRINNPSDDPVGNAKLMTIKGETADNALELTECPYCHRPWIEDSPPPSEYQPDEHERGRSYAATDGPRDYAADRGFVDPDYFGMLAASQRPTPNGSRSATPSNFPRRLFVPALRSGRSREVCGSSQPPDDAQFVASEPAPASGEGISSSAFSPGFFKQFFVEQGELGRGGNGVVLLVEHMMDRVSLGQFACKRVPVGNDHGWLEKVLVEVKLLQKIPHKNLVAYHWVWLEDHQPSKFGPEGIQY